jgi:hypothetical protein
MKKVSDEMLLELATLKDKTKPSNQEFHIFYKLLDSLKDEISFEEETYLVWVFTKTEKSLKEARNGSASLAKYHLDQIIGLRNTEVNQISDLVVDFVMCPARAFYFYANKPSYDEAIALLVEAIKAINVISKVYPEMISASIEQYLNICRVLFRKNDDEKAVSELGKLISFMLSGNCDTSLSTLGSKSTLERLDYLERSSMLDYVTDAAISKILMFENNTNELMKVLWNSIDQRCHSFIDPHGRNFAACFRIALAPETAIQPRCEEFICLIPDLYLLPNSLQYLFLKKIQTHFGFDERVNASIEDYLANKLNIKHLITSGNDKFYKSPLRG